MLIKKLNYSKIIIVIIGFFLPFITLAAWQGGLVPCGTTEHPKPCTLCDFFLLINNIILFIAFRLAPAVAVLMFLIGGIILLTSGGSPQKVSEGKKYFTNTVIGLVIIFISFLIVNTIIKGLAKRVEGFSPETWMIFKCE